MVLSRGTKARKLYFIERVYHTLHEQCHGRSGFFPRTRHRGRTVQPDRTPRNMVFTPRGLFVNRYHLPFLLSKTIPSHKMALTCKYHLSRSLVLKRLGRVLPQKVHPNLPWHHSQYESYPSPDRQKQLLYFLKPGGNILGSPQ